MIINWLLLLYVKMVVVERDVGLGTSPSAVRIWIVWWIAWRFHYNDVYIVYTARQQCNLSARNKLVHTILTNLWFSDYCLASIFEHQKSKEYLEKCKIMYKSIWSNLDICISQFKTKIKKWYILFVQFVKDHCMRNQLFYCKDVCMAIAVIYLLI